MTRTPAPSATAEPFAHRRLQVIDRLSEVFAKSGYGPIVPPVIEQAEHFLDRSGEEMRRRLFIFTDPGGREVCLRPELTIPTVRLFTSRYDLKTGPFRGYYIGPVFRYIGSDSALPAVDSGPDLKARYTQFTQAGAELIGHGGPTADAEAVSLACQALGAAGVKNIVVSVSDISFLTTFIDGQRIADKWRTRLRSLATNPLNLAAFLHNNDRKANDPSRLTDADRKTDLIKTLAGIDSSNRRDVAISMVSSMQGNDHFGSRTIDDIVSRTLELADAADDAGLPTDLVATLARLVSIQKPLREGLTEAGKIAEAADNTELLRLVGVWNRKADLMAAAGMDVDAVVLDLSLGRGIDYYSSFLFKISAEVDDQSVRLCGGGRYDDLVQQLGSPHPAPGIGFAIDVEPTLRVLAAQDVDGSWSNTKPATMLVVPESNSAELAAMEHATRLRAEGQIAVLFDEANPSAALSYARQKGNLSVAVVTSPTLGNGHRSSTGSASVTVHTAEDLR